MLLLTGGGTYSAMTWRNVGVEYSTETRAYAVTAEPPPIGKLASYTISVEATEGNDPGTIQILYGPVRHAIESSTCK